MGLSDAAVGTTATVRIFDFKSLARILVNDW
jgi:hypothetical protein